MSNELAEEFAENGLYDVADYLREHGPAATRDWLDSEIAEAKAHDDPEGWRLGNLQVARDRLTNAPEPSIKETREADLRTILLAHLPHHEWWATRERSTIVMEVDHGPMEGSTWVRLTIEPTDDPGVSPSDVFYPEEEGLAEAKPHPYGWTPECEEQN